MKKTYLIATCILILFSCKKENNSLKKLFKDTAWTGEYEQIGNHYDYCMQFNADDSTMVFYGLYTKAGGKYKVDYQQKKIAIDINNKMIAGDIFFSEDQKFTAFALLTNPYHYNLLNGRVNRAGSLAGTSWRGNWDVPVIVRFMSEDVAVINYANGPDQGFTYTRESQSISFVTPGIYSHTYSGIISDSVIMGSRPYGQGTIRWRLDRQH